jgi:hypothetical protein
MPALVANSAQSEYDPGMVSDGADGPLNDCGRWGCQNSRHEKSNPNNRHSLTSGSYSAKGLAEGQAIGPLAGASC